MNNGSHLLENAQVTDSMGNNVKVDKGSVFASKGYVTWNDNDFIWTIGELDVDEIVTLKISFSVDISCSSTAEVISPQDTYPYSTHEIKRINIDPSGPTETVYYAVVHVFDHRYVRFDEPRPEPLGLNGKKQTDTFYVDVKNSFDKVLVRTKAAGPQIESHMLNGVGDSNLDALGFRTTLVSITQISENVKRYEFTVTSVCNTEPLDSGWVEFDFSGGCEILINQGATITADAGPTVWCEEGLQATTEGISLNVLQLSKTCDVGCDDMCCSCETVKPIIIGPELPYKTPWAWDCCIPSCETCKECQED